MLFDREIEAITYRKREFPVSNLKIQARAQNR